MSNELIIPGITNGNMLVCLSRAKTYGQYCKAVTDALAGRCPFCELDRVHNVVVIETSGLLVWHCNPPEKHTRLHFIIAPRKHILSTDEFTSDEMVAVWDCLTALKDTFKFTSCGILIRDGDATLSGGTIPHLHIHVMVPDGTGRVESPFYKGAVSERESLARAIIFEKMRQGATFGDLTPDEQVQVQGRLT